MKYSIPLFSCASSLAMVGFLKLSRKVVEPTIFTLFYNKYCSFFKISSRLKAYLEAHTRPMFIWRKYPRPMFDFAIAITPSQG